MYVCIYVCMYICMYVYMYVCIYVCMYVYMYVCIYVCMYICMYVYICMLCIIMYTCTCIYIHILMFVNMRPKARANEENYLHKNVNIFWGVNWTYLQIHIPIYLVIKGAHELVRVPQFARTTCIKMQIYFEVYIEHISRFYIPIYLVIKGAHELGELCIFVYVFKEGHVCSHEFKLVFVCMCWIAKVAHELRGRYI